MTAFLSGHLISEPVLSVSAAHLSEVDRIQASDAAVTKIIADAIAQINALGANLPSNRWSRHRYQELTERLAEVASDEMPAPADVDPLDDGEA
jgi:hypothetical protein